MKKLSFQIAVFVIPIATLLSGCCSCDNDNKYVVTSNSVSWEDKYSATAERVGCGCRTSSAFQVESLEPLTKGDTVALREGFVIGIY